MRCHSLSTEGEAQCGGRGHCSKPVNMGARIIPLGQGAGHWVGMRCCYCEYNLPPLIEHLLLLGPVYTFYMCCYTLLRSGHCHPYFTNEKRGSGRSSGRFRKHVCLAPKSRPCPQPSTRT